MSDREYSEKKDIEKDAYGAEVDVQSSQDTFVPSYKYPWLNKFLSWGVEYRGASLYSSYFVEQIR